MTALDTLRILYHDRSRLGPRVSRAAIADWIFVHGFDSHHHAKFARRYRFEVTSAILKSTIFHDFVDFNTHPVN